MAQPLDDHANPGSPPRLDFGKTYTRGPSPDSSSPCSPQSVFDGPRPHFRPVGMLTEEWSKDVEDFVLDHSPATNMLPLDLNFGWTRLNADTSILQAAEAYNDQQDVLCDYNRLQAHSTGSLSSGDQCAPFSSTLSTGTAGHGWRDGADDQQMPEVEPSPRVENTSSRAQRVETSPATSSMATSASVPDRVAISEPLADTNHDKSITNPLKRKRASELLSQRATVLEVQRQSQTQLTEGIHRHLDLHAIIAVDPKGEEVSSRSLSDKSDESGSLQDVMEPQKRRRHTAKPHRALPSSGDIATLRHNSKFPRLFPFKTYYERMCKDILAEFKDCQKRKDTRSVQDYMASTASLMAWNRAVVAYKKENPGVGINLYMDRVLRRQHDHPLPAPTPPKRSFYTQSIRRQYQEQPESALKAIRERREYSPYSSDSSLTSLSSMSWSSFEATAAKAAPPNADRGSSSSPLSWSSSGSTTSDAATANAARPNRVGNLMQPPTDAPASNEPGGSNRPNTINTMQDPTDHTSDLHKNSVPLRRGSKPDARNLPDSNREEWSWTRPWPPQHKAPDQLYLCTPCARYINSHTKQENPDFLGFLTSVFYIGSFPPLGRLDGGKASCARCELCRRERFCLPFRRNFSPHENPRVSALELIKTYVEEINASQTEAN